MGGRQRAAYSKQYTSSHTVAKRNRSHHGLGAPAFDVKYLKSDHFIWGADHGYCRARDIDPLLLSWLLERYLAPATLLAEAAGPLLSAAPARCGALAWIQSMRSHRLLTRLASSHHRSR